MIYFILLLVLFLLSFFKGKCWSIFWIITFIFIFKFPIPLFPRIILYISLFIVYFIFSLFKMKKGNDFDTYFGIPGSGKTTFAAWISKHSKKRVLSNVAIKGTYKIEKNDIGHFDMSNSKVIIDEAGIYLDNRNFKNNLDNLQVEYLKEHRHYKTDFYFFTQYWNDIDIKIRNLSTRLYYVKRSIIPFFIVRRTILKRITINKVDEQIIDGYKFKLFSGYYIFAPKLWKMFKTDERRELPVKEFEKW